MAILADTHVHLYPDRHHLGKTLIHLGLNLTRLAAEAGAPAATLAAFLTERAGQHTFRDLQAATGAAERDDVTVEPAVEPGALRVVAAGIPFYLIAGRQVVAKEGFEVLALAAELEIQDNAVPAVEIIRSIRESGGIPVLPWALGKWWGRRGRAVEQVLARFPSGQVLLGDIAMRPSGPLGWSRVLRGAARRGIRILAGSDPLPLPEDDRGAGTFATCFDAGLDPARPLSSAREALRAAPLRVVGARGSAWTVVRRTLAMRHTQKRIAPGGASFAH